MLAEGPQAPAWEGATPPRLGCSDTIHPGCPGPGCLGQCDHVSGVPREMLCWVGVCEGESGVAPFPSSGQSDTPQNRRL